MKTGDRVIVMYPYDPMWWYTKGRIYRVEGSHAYVIDNYDNKIIITEAYLKPYEAWTQAELAEDTETHFNDPCPDLAASRGVYKLNYGQSKEALREPFKGC